MDSLFTTNYTNGWSICWGYEGSKEPLYVARAMFQITYSIGYYKSSTMRGYFMVGGEVKKSEAMEILVVL